MTFGTVYLGAGGGSEKQIYLLNNREEKRRSQISCGLSTADPSGL